MIDIDKLQRLALNIRDAQIEEKKQAAKLVETGEAHKAQQEIWKRSNESLNDVNRIMTEFLRELGKDSV